MKLTVKSMHSNNTLDVPYVYFDIKNILPILEDELLVKACIQNNELKIAFSKLAKQKLKCYYINLEKLEGAAIKYIKKNPDGLIPPNYNNTEYDHASYKR